MNHRPASLSKSPFHSRSFLHRARARFAVSALVISAGAMLFPDRSAQAAARTWVGSTSTDWNSLNGFDVVPLSGDSLTFGVDGAAGTAAGDTLTNTLAAGFNIGSITFTAAAPAYKMTGNTFNLTAGITNNSTSLQTFNESAPLTTAVGNTFALTGAGITISNGLNFTAGGVTTTVNGVGNTLTLGSLNLTTAGNRINQTINGTGNVTITGAVSATGLTNGVASYLTYGGTGTLTLAGTNTFTGTGTGSAGNFLIANSGTIVLSGSTNSGSTITTGGTGNFTETSTGNILGSGGLYQGSTGTTTLSGANTGTGAFTVANGTLTLSGSINATNATTGSSITVNGGAFNESSTGVINGSGSGATAGGQITLNAGTVDLQGANNTTGNVTVNGGTFTVDSTGGKTANVLKNNGTTLIMGSGTTNFLLSADATANTEVVYQTQFLANTSSLVEVTQNGNTSTTGVINLGNTAAFARNAASITDFGTLPTGTVLENTAGKANSLNGVLASSTTGVAYATVGGGTNFASINATTGVIGTVTPVAGTYGATANVSVTGGDAPASGAGANTLTFAGTTGATLTLTGINTITAGGILVTPTTTGTTTITGGTIRGGAGKELVVINNEPNTAGSLTISSTIADSTSGSSALTIGSTLGAAGIAANPQRTILTAANTFTGQTTLLSGTLNLSNSLALQTSVLQLNTGAALVFDSSVTGNAFTIGGLNTNNNIALVNNAATPAAIALTLNVATGGSFTDNGVLSGTGATLTKTGAGTETLGAANTYTGVTTINGGTLVLGNVAAGKILNTSGVITANGGLLGFNNGNSGSSESNQVGGVISGTGGVTDTQNNGNISFNLDKANTYTGSTNIPVRATLTSTVAPAFDANGNVVSSGFGVNSALVFSNLAVNTGETLLLSTTTQFGSLSSSGATVAASAGNGVVLNNNNLTIGGDNTNTTFNAQISGGAIPNSATNSTRGIGGNLTKIGTGTQTLGGANLYSGSTTINGGTLAVTTIANGGFATTGTATGTTTLTLANGAGAVVGQNIQGSNLGVGSEVISSVNGNTVTLSGVAAAATNTPIAFGTANGLGISTSAASNLVLDGGTLQYTGAAASTDRLFTVGSTAPSPTETTATGTLDASGTGAVSFTNTGAIAYGTNTNQTRTLGLTGTNTGANTLAPSIGDNGAAVSLTKSGAGSWTLTGNNTYTGTTTVSGGILTATGAGVNKALGGTTAIAVNNGGTLLFGAANQASAAAAITLGTTAAQTPASTTGILSFSAGASQGSAETLTGGTAAGGPTVAGLGALTLSNTAALAFGGTNTTLVFGMFTPNGNVLTISGYTNTGAQMAGNSGMAGDDRLVFSGDQSGNFNNFNFGSGAGVGVGEVALDGGFFEITGVTAVPEPSTWVGGVFLLGAMVWQYRRQSRRMAS